MDRDSFLFYKSYYDAAQKIPVKQRLKFYETIINYGLTGTEPEDTGDALIDMALNFIRPLIKANIQNYLNGCKGGAPKGTVNNPSGKNQYSNNRKTTEAKPKYNPRITAGKGNVNEKDNVKGNDKDKVKDKDNENVNVNENIEDLPSAEVDPDYDWFEELEDDRDKE